MTQSSFQTGVVDWMFQCFGHKISADKIERADRFIEEALELAQSVGYPADRVLALLSYVYGRAPGETYQEVGGTMVTLAALCWSHGVDMDEAARTELARVWTKIDAIRAKQAAKPTGSALPIEVSGLTVTRREALDFLGVATRNWAELPDLEEDDIRDLATALLHFASTKSGAAASISKVEAMAPAPLSRISGCGKTVIAVGTTDLQKSDVLSKSGQELLSTWLPVSLADISITNSVTLHETGMTIRNSDTYWVRDEDGRAYEACWTDHRDGYWWDFENESPVNPIEFMPHPLDPRFHQREGGAA